MQCTLSPLQILQVSSDLALSENRAAQNPVVNRQIIIMITIHHWEFSSNYPVVNVPNLEDVLSDTLIAEVSTETATKVVAPGRGAVFNCMLVVSPGSQVLRPPEKIKGKVVQFISFIISFRVKECHNWEVYHIFRHTHIAWYTL